MQKALQKEFHSEIGVFFIDAKLAIYRKMELLYAMYNLFFLFF
jgi:hypothetical protein